MDFNFLNTRHRVPDFAVTLTKSKQSITQKLSDRLISLELTDNRGFEADTVSISLSDHDGKIAFPKRGEKINIDLGWKGEKLTNKGIYIVDEISYQGSPDVLTIRAKSVNLMATLGSGKERSFHGKTIGEIIETIAKENQLTPLVSEEFKKEIIPHIDQNAESTTNFISRIASEHDAIATIKADKLLFIKAGDATTATGKPLPTIEITRSSGDSFHFTLAENQNFDRVVAYYHDFSTGKRGSVKEDRKKDKKNSGITSDSTKVKTLRHTYKSKQAAKKAVKRALSKVERGTANLSITLAEGNAEIFPEIPIKAKGFKKEIDDTDWIVKNVRHTINGNGFTTALELEVKI